MKLHSILARISRLLLIFVFVTGCGRAGALPNSPVGSTSEPQSDTPAPDKPTITPLVQNTIAPTATRLPQLDSPLIWYLCGRAPADLPRVNERLNRELALRGFGAEVEMRVLLPGDFEQRMQEDEKQGESFDIVSMTASSYAEMLETQALLPLNQYHNPLTRQIENLLETNAAGTLANLPPAVWSAWAPPRAGVYGVPNQGQWVQPYGIAIRADVVEALNLQADLDAAQRFTDLTPLFAKIKAAIQNGALNASAAANAGQIDAVFGTADLLHAEIAGYDPLVMPLVVRYDDPSRTVTNWLVTDAFKELAQLRRVWEMKGYSPSEALTPDEVAEGYQSGRFTAAVGQVNGVPRYGNNWIVKPLSPAFIGSGASGASLVGISAKTADQPERVHRSVRFLELLHTDAKLYNLLALGIEGDHWNWVDRDKRLVTQIPGSRYRPDFVNQIGDGSLAYMLDLNATGSVKAAFASNADVPVSVGVGVVFNPKRVAGEAAAVKGLMPEWLDPLSNGAVDNIDTYLKRMVSALDEAGVKAIEAELLEQMKAGTGPG